MMSRGKSRDILLRIIISMTVFLFTINFIEVIAYPPAVGLLGDSQNCLSCHVNNGPWKDNESLIIDIVEQDTHKSLKQSDGSFLITAKRGEVKTILTIIGRKAAETEEIPYRNAWLYVDPSTVTTSSLTKFAPGWNVNHSDVLSNHR